MSSSVPSLTPAADLELVADVHAELGEGPVWNDSTGELLFVDLLQGKFHRLDLSSGEDRVADVGQPLGAVATRSRGGLVLAIRGGFAFADERGGSLQPFSNPDKTPGNRMNDAKCDKAGRFWAGTTSSDGSPNRGSLYRLDPDLTVSTHLSGLSTANGLDWSPDDRCMYYIDTGTQRVDVFDFAAGRGELSNRRPLVELDKSSGLPDGMTVDAQGYVWVALVFGSAVHRYAPDGRLDRVIEVPASVVTSCCFAGPNLDELYITTGTLTLTPERLAMEPHAGGVFRHTAGVQGQPPNSFAG